MRAAVGRNRARDLFDLGFIADKYGDALSVEQIRSAETFTRDYEALADDYRQALQADRLLDKVTTADDRALKFRIAIEEQLHRSGYAGDRTSSACRPLAGCGCRLTPNLAGFGWPTRGRADLSGANFRGKVLVGLNFRQAILDRADFTEADLRNTDLREASLKSVNLEGANLLGANVTGADMQGVKIKRTMLGGSTKGVGEAVARAYNERTASAPAKAPVRTLETPSRDAPEPSWSR